MLVIETQDDARALVYGAAFYGGGGGGWINEGLEAAELALKYAGIIRILDPNEVSDEAILVTVSAVGAPAAEERYLKPTHLVRAIEILKEHGVRIDGIIASEVGAYNAVNGWIQSAVLGIPVVDIPCDGRAHPTGIMGSMGLHRVKGYVSKQAAAGGNPAKGKYIEIYVEANLETASRIVRSAAVEAGGVVAVARNPVKASYARRYGAPGALRKALGVGRVILRNLMDQKYSEACYKALEASEASLCEECIIESVCLETRGGFDVGKARLLCGVEMTLYFLNEYMILEKGDVREATFPDLIVILDPTKGLPVSSAELSNYRGRKVILGVVPRHKIILGHGLRYPEAYDPVEKILGKAMKSFIKDVFVCENPVYA